MKFPHFSAQGRTRTPRIMLVIKDGRRILRGRDWYLIVPFATIALGVLSLLLASLLV
jgi:hypothetical protein